MSVDKQSPYPKWRILQQEKKLIAFQLVAGLLVLGGFIMIESKLWPLRRPNVPLQLVRFYALTTLVITPSALLCNLTIVDYVTSRFTGTDRSLTSTFLSAASRLPQLMLWSLYLMTVGIFSGPPARNFILPVMATEKIGPFPAMQRSQQLIRDRWGANQSLSPKAFDISISSGFALTCIVAFLLVVFFVVAYFEDEIIVAFVVFLGIPLVGGLLAGIVNNTKYHLSLSALYLYATQNIVAEGFSEASFQQDASG